MNKIKLVVLFVMITSITVLFQVNGNLRQENTRVSNNAKQLSTLLSDTVRYLKVNDSINGIKVIKLELKASEMAENTIIDEQLIKDLNIRIKEISAYSHTEAITTYNDTILLRDTLMLLDSSTMTGRTFKEVTRWHSINGIILPDKVIIKSVNKEELEYIEHWTKRKFLFIRIGKKRDSQIILSKNPKTKITKSVFITKMD